MGLGATEGQDAVTQDLLRETSPPCISKGLVQSHNETFSQTHDIGSEKLHSCFTSRDRSGESSYKPLLLVDASFFSEDYCVVLQL